jgi:hypothetical protein
MYDTETEHLMRSYVARGGYVTLIWPKKCTAPELDYISAVVNFQIDAFRRHAVIEEAGELEYLSWMVEGKP